MQPRPASLAFPPAAGFSLALRCFGHASRAGQAIGIEWLDSAKQGLDDLAATTRRLATARGPGEVLALQTAYLSRAGARASTRSTVAGDLMARCAGDLLQPAATPRAGRAA
ncbi:phasin family protein [Methylobacterium sp. J-070]|uniref:phasin family protein n=1 Tax=Methylobacterium sp. J-070 TaxID=2836650 RepID=UPI001FBA7324|nr:phasin family protein [Methylobacterium sp. J-070]MCJ2049055.1 phasin family protein [Methylobacterium sp. J-070]